MVPIKSYLADSLVDKQVHFRCDCLLNIDVIGTVKGWKINNNEILWEVHTQNGKIITIGENHPNMYIKIL